MLLVLLCCFIISDGIAQNTTQVIKKDNDTYEVFCELKFSTNVADNLYDFCWDIKSIEKILADQPVIIEFSEVNSIQTISYDYQFIFMHYFSEYERTQNPYDKIISFTLKKSECSIPFIPNLENGYGTYTIKYNKHITTMQYYQYAKTSGVLRDFYFNYLKKEIEGFFVRFEAEFNMTQNNANY